MDGKGANTFPFHNLPPKLKILKKKGLSCSFHPFLYWIKEKSVATLAIRNICDKTQNTKSVLPPYYRKPYRVQHGPANMER